MPVRHEFTDSEAFEIALRDYFAGQALPSVISGRDWTHMDDGYEKINAWGVAAYLVADAMLSARKGEQE